MRFSAFEIIVIIFCLVTLAAVISAIIIMLKRNNKNDTQEIVNAVSSETQHQQSALRQELVTQTQSSVKNMGEMLLNNQNSFSQNQTEKLSQLEERLKPFRLKMSRNLKISVSRLKNDLHIFSRIITVSLRKCGRRLTKSFRKRLKKR